PCLGEPTRYAGYPALQVVTERTVFRRHAPAYRRDTGQRPGGLRKCLTGANYLSPGDISCPALLPSVQLCLDGRQRVVAGIFKRPLQLPLGRPPPASTKGFEVVPDKALEIWPHGVSGPNLVHGLAIRLLGQRAQHRLHRADDGPHEVAVELGQELLPLFCTALRPDAPGPAAQLRHLAPHQPARRVLHDRAVSVPQTQASP